MESLLAPIPPSAVPALAEFADDTACRLEEVAGAVGEAAGSAPLLASAVFLRQQAALLRAVAAGREAAVWMRAPAAAMREEIEAALGKPVAPRAATAPAPAMRDRIEAAVEDEARRTPVPDARATPATRVNGGVWTAGRLELLRLLYPTSLSREAVLAQINALPGVACSSVGSMQQKASTLGLARGRRGGERAAPPPGYAAPSGPTPEPAADDPWTPERLRVLRSLYPDAARPLPGVLEALRRLPGPPLVAGVAGLHARAQEEGLRRGRAKPAPVVAGPAWSPERDALLRQAYAASVAAGAAARLLAGLNALPGPPVEFPGIHERAAALGLPARRWTEQDAEAQADTMRPSAEDLHTARELANREDFSAVELRARIGLGAVADWEHFLIHDAWPAGGA